MNRGCMEKRNLLDHMEVSKEERLVLARILDKEEQSRRRNISTYTDFLTRREQTLALDVLHAIGSSPNEYCFQGGWDGAERQILRFLPDWMDLDFADSPLRYLRALYPPDEHLSHRDLLGSLMGLGIAREKVGDILVSPESADLIVFDRTSDFLLQNWSSAGRSKLRVMSIERGQLHFPEARIQELRDTVSSLRLDAVCAAGFRTSRSKAAELIAAGRVQLNWRNCVKTDQTVVEGSTISARGLGKFKLKEVVGRTRKDRLSIVIHRYL